MSNRQDDALPVVAYRINAMEGQEVKPHWMYLAPGQHSWQHLSNFTADPLVRLSDAQSAIASLQARLDAAEADAARYRWLCDKFGVTKLPCAIERILEGKYVADGKYSIDAAIDAAREQS